MKTLYFDCISGISGDMVIGALIDAGADPMILEEELRKLQIEEEYQLKWEKVIKNGITSTKFDVLLTDKHIHNHQHDHAPKHTHDHGHEHSHDHKHDHAHEHSHDHKHDHAHEHGHDHKHDHAHEHGHDHKHEHSHEHDHDHDHAHSHHHRGYQDIVELIEAAGFTVHVKETALKIFKKIGEAEGRIHGIPLDRVHFHEVGAVDSIIDIVGAAILLHQLDISVIKSSSIPVGAGRIHIDHGIYPVPAPATLEILKEVPIEQSNIRAELTTPTGAAIVSVLAEEFCTIPSMKVKSIGYGAGTKSFPNHPNVLRVIIGE